MSNIIIPGKPARPIVVEPSGPAAQVRVDSGGRIPPGGAAGQSLLKASDQDYATEWGTVTASVSWDDVSGKPTFATVATTGAYGDLTGLPTLFSGAYGDLTGIPSTFATTAALISDATTAGRSMLTAADAAAQRTLLSVETTTQLNTRDTNNRARANHTGTQLASTISDFATAVAATAAVTANTAKVTNATHTGDVTGATALTIANDVVTNAKLANMATATFKGRTTAGTGDPEDLTVAQAKTLLNLTGTNSGDQTITLTGDVTGSGTGSFAATIAADAVTNAKLANVATATIKGRTTAGTGDPEDLTGTQATALLDLATTSLKGLAPARSGVATEYLDGTGNYSVPAGGGGGGGTPGGTTGQVQYNNAGAFDGATDVEIEGGQLRLDTIAPPAAPAAGGVKLFGRAVGGRNMAAFMGASGLDSALQPHFGRNAIQMWRPNGNVTTSQNFGGLVTATGTITGQTITTTNLFTYMRRIAWAITTASTTAVVGLRGTIQCFSVGGPSAGLGGFHMILRFGPSIGVSNGSHRIFAGMRGSTAAPTDVNPSTLTNICGMGYDAADANVQFMHNDGSGAATKIDLGASFPKPTVDNTTVYEVAMFCPPGTTQDLRYEVTNLTTGAVATGTVTTNLPLTTQLLAPWTMMSVGGVSSVVGASYMGLYVETDF